MSSGTPTNSLYGTVTEPTQFHPTLVLPFSTDNIRLNCIHSKLVNFFYLRHGTGEGRRDRWKRYVTDLILRIRGGVVPGNHSRSKGTRDLHQDLSRTNPQVPLGSTRGFRFRSTRSLPYTVLLRSQCGSVEEVLR